MSLPRIIGITGFARNGKGTVAGVLERELGYNHVNLADQLKRALVILNPIVRSYAFPKHPERLATLVGLLGWEKAKADPEVRRLMQIMGTEVARDMFGQDIWIQALRNTRGFDDPERKIVISDVRFPNEAAFVRSEGGEVWKVERPDFDSGVPADHPSERFVPTIEADVTFINAGSKADFQDKVYRVLKNRMARIDPIVVSIAKSHYE